MSSILYITPQSAPMTLAQFLEGQGHWLTKTNILDLDSALSVENGHSSSDVPSEGIGEEPWSQLFHGGQPDVILWEVDGATPGQYERTIRSLKSNPRTEEIPLVVLSQQEVFELDALHGWLDAGADHVLDFAQDHEASTKNLLFILKLRQALKQAESLATQMTELNSELYERNCQIEKELYVARQLQQSLLPPSIEEPDKVERAQYTDEDLLNNPELAESMMSQFTKCHYLTDHLRITGVYLPCDALGGDLYDIIPFKDNTVGVSVADVSGHGVPAGFVTAIFKASLYRATLTFTSPGDILFHLNNELANIVKTGDYVTGIYCYITEDGKKLQYSGAGHPYPIYYRAESKTIERLTENGTPLVWIPDMDYPVGEVTLAPGDKVLIFTDGISEVNNPKNEILGEPALEEIFLKAMASKTDDMEILDALMVAVSEFTEGHPLGDDMSIVLIEAR